MTASVAAPTGQKLEWLARIGYASRALVYILAGLLSLSAALEGGRSAGPKGAFGKVIQVPFGDILLYCIALGLICFAVWRTTQAIYDPDRFNRGPSSALRRLIVYGGSAFIHFGLAVAAINVAFVKRSADEDREARDWTAWLLSQPFGRALTMIVGLGIAIAGLAFVFQAFKAEFRKNLMEYKNEKKWIVTLGTDWFRGTWRCLHFGGLLFDNRWLVSRSPAGHRRCRSAESHAKQRLRRAVAGRHSGWTILLRSL